jgi:hypothetical protein
MLSDAPDNTTVCTSSCVVCGAEFPVQKMGRPRRYCNRACAKNAGRRVSSNNQASLQTARPAEHPGPEAGGVFVAGQGLSENDARDPLEDVSADFRTWYYANFASPAGQDPISARRKLRYRLRHLLREVTTVDRCRGCGREPIANGIQIRVSVNNGRTTAGYGGLETCGRIWLCPVCASKIRVRRGDQIAEAVARHIDGGGAAWFITITLPHEKGDALKDSFDALTKAWQYVKNGKRHQEDKKNFGILGDIKAVEVTHGGLKA